MHKILERLINEAVRHVPPGEYVDGMEPTPHEDATDIVSALRKELETIINERFHEMYASKGHERLIDQDRYVIGDVIKDLFDEPARPR